tara:strand:+ start:113 stop:2719 length:2607 start_codon:yes stop_codon:yes gene_type:complete
MNISYEIEGKTLEKSQKEAILAKDKNVCVNAGAGSGKTLTILAKLIHLLHENLAAPEEIIIVAYNKKVAEELRERIFNLSKSFPDIEKELKRISISSGFDCPQCNEEITTTLHYCDKTFLHYYNGTNECFDRKVHTFHSLCYDQLQKNKTMGIAPFLKTEDKKLFEYRTNKVIKDLIKEIAKENKDFLSKINKFFLKYLNAYKNIFKDVKSMEEYNKLIKPRRICLKINEDTDEDEKDYIEVKSQEELEIANFLYLRGIEFVYEDPYKGELPEGWRGEYKPDFHLFKKDENGETEYDIYYEHFALDEKGEPPEFFDSVKKYKNDYQEKKKFLGDKLVCTYSYEKLNDTLFENLTKRLRDKGIDVPEKNIISDEEALEKFMDAGYFNQFSSLLGTFLTNFKQREAKLNKLKRKVEKPFSSSSDTIEHKRERVFVEIFELVFKAYQKKLRVENVVDFEDMLTKGMEYIENQNIKYLIVDEFQDISPLRARVLQEFQKHNKNLQLFCVGDDWQSIYRFSAGDIKIIVSQFEQYFGNRTMVDLGFTYRFNNRLSELTSSFILKNTDGQLKKEIKGRDDDEIPLLIYTQRTTKDKFKVDFSVRLHILKRLDYIFSNEGDSIKKILFLSRYNSFVHHNGYEDLEKFIRYIFESKKKIIKFSTIHSAKGDEADYVFLVNVDDDGSLGFPSNIQDDPILSLVNDDTDKFEHEEERRLFYVALTRTKKQVFLYGDENSYFVKEIDKDKNNKEEHHYKKQMIPVSDAEGIEYSIVVTKNKKVKETGLKINDEIIKINNINNPTKWKIGKILSESQGEEIDCYVKNGNGENIIKITPIPIEKEDEIKKYALPFECFQKEIHPYIDELKKKYKIADLDSG